MIVLYTDATGTRRVTLRTSQAACVLESAELLEDGWVVTERVVLHMQTVVELIPILVTFVANRPKQIHNNIEWSVRGGTIVLNDVPMACLPHTGARQTRALELVSKLLTRNVTLNLFNDMPKLSDTESELWITARISAFADVSEF